jgi:hypothetical protein
MLHLNFDSLFSSSLSEEKIGMNTDVHKRCTTQAHFCLVYMQSGTKMFTGQFALAICKHAEKIFKQSTH